MPLALHGTLSGIFRAFSDSRKLGRIWADNFLLARVLKISPLERWVPSALLGMGDLLLW